MKILISTFVLVVLASMAFWHFYTSEESAVEANEVRQLAEQNPSATVPAIPAVEPENTPKHAVSQVAASVEEVVAVDTKNNTADVIEPPTNSSEKDNAQSVGDASIDESQESPELLAKNGEWSQVLQTLELLPEVDDTHLDEALKLAIQFDAPIWVFEDLLYKGAAFNHLHLFQLVRDRQLTLLKSLVSLGLDIHMEAPNGSNAVHVVFDSYDDTVKDAYMLHHMLYEGVRVTTKVSKVDPLEKALLIIKSDLDRRKESESQYIRYVRGLVWPDSLVIFGAQVEAKHLKLMREIKNYSEYAYEYITANADALKVD